MVGRHATPLVRGLVDDGSPLKLCHPRKENLLPILHDVYPLMTILINPFLGRLWLKAAAL